MTVYINGEERALPDDMSVADMLEALSDGETRLAVVINEEVVPQVEHSCRILKDEDRVEVLTFAGGG